MRTWSTPVAATIRNLRRENLTSGAGICVIAACAITAFPAHARAGETEGPSYKIDIGGQTLPQALRNYAQVFGQEIIFSESLFEGTERVNLKGDYSARDALNRLLEGTGLEHERSPNGTIMIRRRSERIQLAQNSEAPRAESQQPRAAASQNQDGNDVPSDVMPEEIVVTARRRSEVLTEVPISITAYSSDFLQEQNIRSFTDFATRIPSVTFQYGGAENGFSEGRVTTIRGVAGPNTTALYINDTPVPAAVTPQTLNLQRMEVLKGPQGTLFGASSMGGNLRFITLEPSLTKDSISTQVGVGSTKDGGTDYDANVRGSFVLIPDRLAVDAATSYVRESGYITRRFPDGSGNLISKDEQGQKDTIAGSISLRAALTDRLEASLSGMGQTSDLHGWPAAYVPLPDYRVLSYTMDRDRDVQEYSKDRWALGALVLKYQGEGFSVISSSSYFQRRVKEQADSTEGANSFILDVFGVDLGSPPIRIIDVDKSAEFTQETRLAFDKGLILPELSGVVGAFYQRNKLSGHSPDTYIPELAESGLFDGGYLGAYTSRGLDTHLAVFGEVYYEVVPQLTVSLGLRHYWIKQTMDEYIVSGFVVGGEPSLVPALRNKDSGTVPKVVVSYEIGDRGTVYASASKGFRVGGAQQELPVLCDQDLSDLGFSRADTRSYKPDNLWSYEIGAKNNFGDGRLAVSAAAFQIDWTQIQQNVVLPTCTFAFTGNAGKARIRGGELELSGRPIDAVPLTVQLGVGYTDGVLIDPGLVPQAANTDLVQVPNWTPSISGYYEAPLWASTSLFAAADYSYTSEVKATDGQGGFVTRQPFNMVNANVGVRFGQTDVRLYVRNLLDKRLNYGDLIGAGFERTVPQSDGPPLRYPEAAVSRPRQIGLQVNMQF